MTKFVKMSLVAAVAVTGLSTTSFAQPLEEAIKNVDVSGTVVYRYNDYESKAATNNNATNNYKMAVNVSSKVNDDITANTRFIMGKDGTTDAVGLGTSTDGDASVNVQLSEVNFTYTGVQGLSVTVGKQGIATPWTVARDSMGDEQTGTGVVAVYSFGPATLVGAYFNQTNFNSAETGLSGSKDIYVLGAMATFAGITLDGFYADLDDNFDAYTIGVNGSFDLGAVNLAPFARYSQLDPEGAAATALGTTEDQKLWQLGLTATMGIFEGFVAYGESGSNGGLVYIDSGAATNMDYHWRVTADGSADTDYLYVHATAQVTDKINVGLYYSEADYKTANDVDEIYGKVSYQMSKNFETYVQFGEYSVDGSDADGSMGRLNVQYTF
ncbi:major outer membrane protein [Halarcobacter ebronensis]|nr:major outer membrane protein [Halarcobacter ebronensis]QKF80924.1 Campylo_MOMP domain-containing protein [Halarcobacter ebronensis]